MSVPKDVLVIVDANGDRPSLGVASDLALAFDAHLTGLALIRDTVGPSFAMTPAPSELIIAARDAAEEEAARARAAFDEAGRKVGVPYGAFTVNLLIDGFDNVLRFCRLTDVVVIGQDNPDVPEPVRGPLLQAIIFDSGIPTILVPNAWKHGLKLSKVLVAWDGSATAARAAHAALPFLAKSSEITVLIVEGESRVEDETGFDIGDYLARHDLKVEIVRVPKSGSGVADALLNYVADNDIELVVMGAYGHNRVREMIFGGATRDILGELTVPVLLAH